MRKPNGMTNSHTSASNFNLWLFLFMFCFIHFLFVVQGRYPADICCRRGQPRYLPISRRA
jgi:hypothetical protein